MIFHPPFFCGAVRALIFLARRIQPFFPLVDREVEFCVLNDLLNDLIDLIVLHSLSIFIFIFYFSVRKIPFTGI